MKKFFAGLIFLFLLSSVYSQQNELAGRKSLEKIRKYILKGNILKALERSSKVLINYPKTLSFIY